MLHDRKAGRGQYGLYSEVALAKNLESGEGTNGLMGGTEDFLDGMGGHMVGDKGPMGGGCQNLY